MIRPFSFWAAICSVMGVVTVTLPDAATGGEAGDRQPPVRQVFPPDTFYHSGKGGRVLDVTRPPFNAKGDGVTDDTEALVAALRFVREHYDRLAGDGYAYCTRRRNRDWIVYLPDGVYRVSGTVSQGWPAQAINIRDGWDKVRTVTVESPEHEQKLNADGKQTVYGECNWAIRIVGQSREGTIIRLADDTPGFEAGENKPILALCLLECGSNVNVGNFVRNLTLDAGRGNPGAVGLAWSSSNYGGIRNVAIRAGQGSGSVGLLMNRRNATGYLHDIRIDGFDVGLDLSAGAETAITLEYASFNRQREVAIRAGGAHGKNSFSARKIAVRDAPTAVRLGRNTLGVLLDCTFSANDKRDAAMVLADDACVYARGLTVSGYASALHKNGQSLLPGGKIDEYASVKMLGREDRGAALALQLPVRDTPLILPEQDVTQWANVDDFGASGDGVTDDTAAVQKAMSSGRPVVYFPQAHYVINGTVDIPPEVREVDFLFGAIYRSVARGHTNSGIFRVTGHSQSPLLLHSAVTAGGVFVEHAGERPLILEEIEVYFHHCRGYAARPDMLFPGPAAQDVPVWRLYHNADPLGPQKTLFVEALAKPPGRCA